MTDRRAAVLTLVSCGWLLVACSSHTPDAVDAVDALVRSPSSTVNVSVLGCGKGWQPSSTGSFHLSFTNSDTQNGEVRIVGVGRAGAPTGAIFADIEPLAAGSTANLDIALGPGDYAIQCLLEASSAVRGPTLHLTGETPPGAATGVSAVTLDDLAKPIRDYQTWVSSQLPALVRDVQSMRAALLTGDRVKAQAAWRDGHAQYERLGAAYGAFGDLDGSINGLPYGLRRGTHDPAWTGFHAIEYGLWGAAKPQALVALADRLVTDVRGLAALMVLPPEENPTDPEIKVAPGSIDALTFSIRAHEITENSLQLSLTGEDDFGSHASLESVAANLDGTVQVLDIMQPPLEGRIDRRPIDAGIAAARDAIAQAGSSDIRELARPARQRVNAAISQLTELLAPVAVVLEPRRAS